MLYLFDKFGFVGKSQPSGMLHLQTFLKEEKLNIKNFQLFL